MPKPYRPFAGSVSTCLEGWLFRRLLVDITPLREFREYRLLFSGFAISQLGRQLTVVAAPLQVFQMTHSTVAVGLLGLAQFPLLIAGSLIGGVLADSVDRRKLMMVAQVILAVLAVGLAVNAMLAAPQLWLVYALTAALAGVSGIDSPTRSASVPRLVGAAHLQSALSLQQAMFQTSAVIGPAIAGLLITKVSLSAVYWIDAVSFTAAFGALLMMKPLLAEGAGESRGIASMMEGIRFLKGRQALKGVFLVDLNAMILGAPRALFPEFGTVIFGGTGATVGLLYAAPGVGALLGAVLSGWVPKVRRAGRAVLVAVAIWGAAVMAFGLAPSLPVALGALAVAGAADVISAVFRNTILQLSVPDRLRGRLSAVQIAVVTGGPRLGDAEAGTVAGLAGVRVSAWSGGLACLAGVAAIAAWMPRFRDWERQHE